jgi:hypothetical protein
MTYRPPESPLKVIRHVQVMPFMQRWPDPSPDDVRELWKAMTAKYNTHVIDKNNSAEMKLVADVLDRLKIVDKEKFLREYVTTVGDGIYTPFTPGIVVGPWDLWQQTMVVGHEHRHVEQDRAKEGLIFELEYATNATKRAFYEMEAYRVNMTLAWYFRREELSPVSLAAMLSDYGCSLADVEMVAKMLKLSLVSIKKGAIPSPACQFEIDWLKARWAA